nr:MAG TPA: hypothetical protein [Caudoviricetes sp.]
MEQTNKTTEAQRNAIKKYDAKTYQKKTFRFHKEKDIDVLEKLAAVDSQNSYIIDLIRKDINK